MWMPKSMREAPQYELLKCDGCGKELGYIYEKVTQWPPRVYSKLFTGYYLKIKRTTFCEECFLKRKDEITKP